jgi:hypothetical protein
MHDQPKVTGPAANFPSIERRSGRPIAEWTALIRTRDGGRHTEIVNWLKSEDGM